MPSSSFRASSAHGSGPCGPDSSATDRRLAPRLSPGLREAGDEPSDGSKRSSSSCAMTALTESSSSETLKRMQPLRTISTGASRASESAGSTRREYRVASRSERISACQFMSVVSCAPVGVKRWVHTMRLRERLWPVGTAGVSCSSSLRSSSSSSSWSVSGAQRVFASPNMSTSSTSSLVLLDLERADTVARHHQT
eukprot:scaffold28987_cov63-Phaeocystis_antarctica.AAC.3